MNTFARLRWQLFFQTLHRRIACAVVHLGRHRYDEPQAVTISGPLLRDDGTLVPPRERLWEVVAFHRQCQLCWHVDRVPFTAKQAAAAIEDAIKEDEEDES